jgi:hypothetical protein
VGKNENQRPASARPGSNTVSSNAKARVAPNPSKAATPVRESLVRAERRRSQRVLLRTKMQIHVALAGKLSTIEGMTLSVNPQGALVVLAKNLPPETRLVLEHATTKEKIACRIPRAAREMPEGFHVSIEFDSPAPAFWGITFPPEDWRVENE